MILAYYLSNPAMANSEQKVELKFRSCADELMRIRSIVRETAISYGADKKAADCVVLAINEACMNIIQHAYGDESEGDIVLEIFNHGDELIFHISDFAPPVDKDKVKSRDLDDVRPGGLGVHLMRNVMDKVTFLDPPEGIGNVLELRKKIK